MRWQCTSCGETMEQSEIQHKVIRNRRRLGPPDDDQEDDRLEKCPYCGAIETMREVDDE